MQKSVRAREDLHRKERLYAAGDADVASGPEIKDHWISSSSFDCTSQICLSVVIVVQVVMYFDDNSRARSTGTMLHFHSRQKMYQQFVLRKKHPEMSSRRPRPRAPCPPSTSEVSPMPVVNVRLDAMPRRPPACLPVDEDVHAKIRCTDLDLKIGY